MEASKASRSTNKFHTVSQAFDCSIKRDSQQTVSEEDVRDYEFSGYHDNELLATSRSEGYRNPRGPSLEQIEKEMRQLQEKLLEVRKLSACFLLSSTENSDWRPRVIDRWAGGSLTRRSRRSLCCLLVKTTWWIKMQLQMIRAQFSQSTRSAIVEVNNQMLCMSRLRSLDFCRKWRHLDITA